MVQCLNSAQQRLCRFIFKHHKLCRSYQIETIFVSSPSPIAIFEFQFISVHHQIIPFRAHLYLCQTPALDAPNPSTASFASFLLFILSICAAHFFMYSFACAYLCSNFLTVLLSSRNASFSSIVCRNLSCAVRNSRNLANSSCCN
eukprot:499776_1